MQYNVTSNVILTILIRLKEIGENILISCLNGEEMTWSKFELTDSFIKERYELTKYVENIFDINFSWQKNYVLVFCLFLYKAIYLVVLW